MSSEPLDSGPPSPDQPTGQGVPRLPRMLGKYRLLRKLGEGGMGVVFQGEDTVLHRPVAVKILSGPHAQNNAIVGRFLREARAAARLNHPHVVSIYDVNTVGAVAYLVMELLTGGSVQDVLSTRGALDWELATRYVAQAGKGLAAAHLAELIHRDVKPANLLLTDDGTVKVADFGLAKMLDAEASKLSSPSHLLGTPHYMSPEQCRGEELDERTDIYSLGASWYTLLTGRALFQAENNYGLLFAHCSHPPPDPRKYVPDLPGRLVEVLHRALAKARSERHAMMSDLVVDLERLVNQTLVASRLITPPPLPSHLLPKPPRRWSRRAAVALLLLGAGGVAGWSLSRPRGAGEDDRPRPATSPGKPWPEVLGALEERNPKWKRNAVPVFGEDRKTVVELTLKGDELVDLSPLAKLTNLQVLGYEGSSWMKGKLADLSPLADLPLRELAVKHCDVRSIEPLRHLPLKKLILFALHLKDVSPLRTQPIETLALDNLLLDSLEPLRHLKSVSDLLIVCGDFPSLDPLADLPRLTRLKLFHYRKLDLGPLARTPLAYLDVTGAGRGGAMFDLAPLLGSKLQTLRCDPEFARTHAALLRKFVGLKVVTPG